MSLRDRLNTDMKDAMRSRDSLRLETIRGVRGEMKNREIDSGETLDDAGIQAVIRKFMKQRVDAIEQYRAAGRDDLADKEASEKELLESYLPDALGLEDVEKAVREVIAEVGASGPRDMGKVMKPTLDRLGPAADGKMVSATVKRLLSDQG